MLVVLDLSASCCIKGEVQYCNTPEGFASIKEMHPDDEFVIKDESSWDKYEDFTDFLDALGWLPSDYFAAKSFEDSILGSY